VKRSLLPILLLLLLPQLSHGEEIGAFFTRVNAYVYADGPDTGKRYLVRPRQALPVLNLKTDQDDKLWLYISHPKRSVKRTGTGWTPLTPGELLGFGRKPVKIFADVFEDGSSPPEVTEVPAADVKLQNVTKASAHFPQIVWHKVRYTTDSPLLAWINSGAGIFRPNKTTEYLSRTYVEMVSRNLEKEKLERLLSGVVRVGDTAWEVEQALGKPLRVQEDQAQSPNRSTWQYSSLSIRFENQVVNQIN
jgi:hypothetical protein